MSCGRRHGSGEYSIARAQRMFTLDVPRQTESGDQQNRSGDSDGDSFLARAEFTKLKAPRSNPGNSLSVAGGNRCCVSVLLSILWRRCTFCRRSWMRFLGGCLPQALFWFWVLDRSPSKSRTFSPIARRSSRARERARWPAQAPAFQVKFCGILWPNRRTMRMRARAFHARREQKWLRKFRRSLRGSRWLRAGGIATPAAAGAALAVEAASSAWARAIISAGVCAGAAAFSWAAATRAACSSVTSQNTGSREVNSRSA